MTGSVGKLSEQVHTFGSQRSFQNVADSLGCEDVGFLRCKPGDTSLFLALFDDNEWPPILIKCKAAIATHRSGVE